MSILSRLKRRHPLIEPWEPTPQFQEQRKHLPDTPYLLPKDKQEDERIGYQHYALYRTIGNHYLAPLALTGPCQILDVGTGTGIWPVEMGKLFPEARITGVDISFASLPQPLPTNVTFVEANVLNTLPFPNGQFAYTHQRLMVAAIQADQWPGVLRELVRVTAPKGWVEILEVGNQIQHAGPATQRLLAWMNENSKQQGFDMHILEHVGNLLQQAGCQDVDAQHILIPLGSWAGPEGKLMQANVIQAYHAVKDTYCARSHTPTKQVDAMIDAAAQEWEYNQCSYVFYSTYGRKRA